METALILAAGYATRLYPLTKNFPKPLLEVGGKPVLNYTLTKLEELNIKRAIIVTNSRYYPHFQQWKQQLKTGINIEILDDGTSTEETNLGSIPYIHLSIKKKRFGSIADMHLAIEKAKLRGPLLLIAGDNLFDFSLKPMQDYFRKANKTTISLFEVEDINKLKKSGTALIDKNNKIILVEEKPEHPKQGAYHANCMYFLTSSTLQKIQQYLQEGNNPDQPGRFIEWLYQREEIHGFFNKGSIIDIGTPETLEKARKEFK